MFNKCSILKKMCSLLFFVAFISIIIIVNETASYSQSAGGIIGTVRELKSKNILAGVNIAVKGTGLGTATNSAGEYILTDLNPGSYILEFSSIGYEDIEITNVTVKAGENTRLDVVLRQRIITLADVTVVGASKRVEKITHAPAAISKINPLQIQQFAITGQIPELLRSEPGIDIVENDINDYNVNARGFNTSLNRRMLVLQDYRETAMAFLLAQEWNSFSLPIDDFAEVEVVRGPGSALYCANAFFGVMNIITPAPEKIKGTKVTLAGGELNSIRGDIRHAGFQGPWGYKFNVGAFRSDSWSKSRNLLQEMLDKNEYPGLEREFAPVNDEGLSTAYASLRTDYNFFNGSVATTEGGIAQAANQVFVTGIGRVQVSEVIRPWGRLNYTSDKFFVQVDYNGRKTLSGHQIALNSLSVFKEDSYDIK